MHLLGECSELICFWVMMAQFGPPCSGQKNDWKWFKMVVSHHYLKKYSHDLIQTCGFHLLGERSEMIHFWVMLAQLWPFSGQKMT